MRDALPGIAVPNPHDKLVRRTFGDIAHARGLLPGLLPRALSARIDWNALRLVDGSFVDPRLAERQTDLLYRAWIGEREVLLYLLLEHQSSSDPFMPLRMFVYAGRIWERHLEHEPQSKVLPAIVPVVLHHSRRGWRAPTRLSELIHADAPMRELLGPLLPELQFHLVDLTREDDQSLRAALHSRRLSRRFWRAS
jgi:predicted transposase YdaD